MPHTPQRRIRKSRVSVLFSEPKIPQSETCAHVAYARTAFQCSSASRKFLNTRLSETLLYVASVSVLFSEPKIPQSTYAAAICTNGLSFSALQRAENSSIVTRAPSPHTLQRRFSALQRAENSSIVLVYQHKWSQIEFQCSSASRKFLNSLSVGRQPTG